MTALCKEVRPNTKKLSSIQLKTGHHRLKHFATFEEKLKNYKKLVT